VAGALGSELEAVAAGEGDDRHDVVRVRRERDVGGALIDREVPGATRGVPVRLVGRDDLTGEDRHVLLDGFRVQHAAEPPSAAPPRIGGDP
jgi:hypothetical protein